MLRTYSGYSHNVNLGTGNVTLSEYLRIFFPNLALSRAGMGHGSLKVLNDTKLFLNEFLGPFFLPLLTANWLKLNFVLVEFCSS